MELGRARRELAKVKQERDLPKKVCGILCERVPVKYAQIHRLRHQHSIAAMCLVLDVSESDYYAWRKRPPSPREKAVERLTLEPIASRLLRSSDYAWRRGVMRKFDQVYSNSESCGIRASERNCFFRRRFTACALTSLRETTNTRSPYLKISACVNHAASSIH